MQKVIAILWIVGLVAGVSAQSPKSEGVATLKADDGPASIGGVPLVPQDTQQAAVTLQLQWAGLMHAQAIIQKEIDSTAAQLQRTLQQAQAVCAAKPGYELVTAPTLACRAKKPDETKK